MLFRESAHIVAWPEALSADRDGLSVVASQAIVRTRTEGFA